MQKPKMDKSFLATTALLLCLLNHGTDMARAWDDQDFFTYCPPSRCSKDGPEIRFPLWLESSNTSSPACRSGATCTKITCSGQDTILLHPFLGPSKVIAMDYRLALMKIIPLAEHNSACPIEKLSLPEHVNYRCELYSNDPGRLVGCSREFIPSGVAALQQNLDNCGGARPDQCPNYIAGPIPCLTNPGRFTYLVHADLAVALLPVDCKAISNSSIPVTLTTFHRSTFKQRAEAIFRSSEILVSWILVKEGFTEECRDCELFEGKRCAFSSQRNRAFCMPYNNGSISGSSVKVIAASSSVASFIVLSIMVAAVLYLLLKSKYDEEIHLKVEMFLQTYEKLKPTRYSFTEVKKIAKRFKQRVGQGGFGSVYRGQLPNGLPVAVKVLENSTRECEEFINEVATIGKIHHANIVRMLGFCSEGARRALIYEFMPNKSLDKYIFTCGFNSSQGLLPPNKMLHVATGIARGMEYLHQGCNQRILHFDIKPHNILLDYNFNPKISDFGLAKLCSRDHSIVTLTTARGTMGYIAPELYSRNFGGISYKSDVYSFGMLVLEMVSGRRNSDPGIENQNEVYLPQWIYERVIAGQDMVLNSEITEEENKMLRQLAIMALWCIQWNPKNRPSMTKVVNMLAGGLQNLQVPPKPFASSES